MKNPFGDRNWKESMTPRQLKILLVVLDMAAKGEHITYRSVMAKTGIRSTNGIRPVVHKMIRFGLLKMEPNTTGTLRPSCTLEVIPREAFVPSAPR